MKIIAFMMHRCAKLLLLIFNLLLVGCTTFNPAGCQNSALFITDLTHLTQPQSTLLPDGTACSLEAR